MTGILVLRLLHVVGGVLWTGAAVFVAVFLIPLLGTLGPNAGPAMQHLGEKLKFPMYMLALALITILSGGALAWRDSGVLGFAWFQQGSGLMFGIGAVCAVIGLGIGLGVSLPAGKQAGVLAAKMKSAGRPPSAEEQAEMRRAQGRVMGAARAIAALLVLTTICMAVARYV